jgi:chromosome partitioning protein
MKIALANQLGASASAILMNLAVLRARSGRKLLLVDTTRARHSYGWGNARRESGLRPWFATRALDGRRLAAEIGDFTEQYNDIVVDMAGYDTAQARSVFATVNLVLVPVLPRMAGLATQYQLITSLNAARLHNPAIRVVFAIVGEQAPATEDELAIARAYASRVALASLASTTVCVPAELDYGIGRCVCDAETCDPERAAEMHALYREVYAQAPSVARHF